MKGNTVYLGSEFKLSINIEPIGDITMKEYDFICEFYCTRNKKVTVEKQDMLYQDDGNYVITMDSKDLGSGILKCKITAYIPDADFEDGIRTEVLVIDTGIQIQGA